MKHSLVTYTTVSAFFLFFSCQLSAQSIKRSTLSSTGSTITTENVYLSSSTGQSSITGTQTSSDSKIHQGFQQPLQLTNGSVSKLIDLEIYPNPNTGSFYLNTSLPEDTDYSFVLFDMNGKQVTEGSAISGNRKLVELPNGAESGTYHIHILTTEKLAGSTKIIVTH